MKEYIYKEVQKLKTRYKTSDPFQILKAMHVEVWDTPHNCDMKGFCFLSNRQFYISINPTLPPQMRRIVAAHELGHIILHKSRLKMAMMTDYSIDSIQKDAEYEANLFAAELLLEDDDIISEMDQDNSNYFSLCSGLNITPSMMSFKLYSMSNRGYSLQLPIEIDSRCLRK